MGRGLRRIVADISSSVSASTAAAALGDLAAAEAAGIYMRLTPSRAWRDRFVWDCRTVAAVLCTVDEEANALAAAADAGADAAAAVENGVRVVNRSSRGMGRREEKCGCGDRPLARRTCGSSLVSGGDPTTSVTTRGHRRRRQEDGPCSSARGEKLQRRGG